MTLIVLCADNVTGLETQLNVLCDNARRLDLIVNLVKSNIVAFRNGGFLTTKESVLFNDSELKVVNMYKYLGIYLSTKLPFSYTSNDLEDRAKKCISAIVKLLWSVCEHSPSVVYKLFDSEIQLILTYGSEIWGLSSDQKYLERAHLSALKRCIGVSPKSPRHLIYGETGRYPLSLNTYSRCIQFWLRITMLGDHIIISEESIQYAICPSETIL